MDRGVIIIGGGIAGAAAAYFLSNSHEVLLLEREAQLGYHSTGRSAAVYTENYSSDAVSALVRASGHFLRSPPSGFSQSLLRPLGYMTVGYLGQEEQLDKAYYTGKRRTARFERHDRQFVLDRVPVMRPDGLMGCVFEPDASDIDVNELLWGYIRGVRANGGAVKADAHVRSLTWSYGRWLVELQDGNSFEGSILVNAAGAWADDIGRLARARALGLQARRRTAVVVDVPAPTGLMGCPMVGNVAGNLYFRPVAGGVLASPVDQTQTAPCDAQPEEIDVAIVAERLQQMTTMAVTKIRSKWAGLRCFVSDELPVIGWDTTVPNFYWIAGQGGAGVKTSPILGLIAKADLCREVWPKEAVAEGLRSEIFSPFRLQQVLAP